MWNTELNKKKPEPIFLRRSFLIGLAVASIVFSLVVLGLSVYEGIFNGGRMRVLRLPGFHELKLDTAGLYAGVYQHRGAGPIPVKELTAMDVRVMSKDDYEEVPVLMNTAGQTFNQLGMQGLPLFNFMIPHAGSYTLSGVYTGAVNGPTVSVLLFPQAAQNVKQTLFVGGAFFIFFLVVGIFVLVRLNHWAPKKKERAP